MDLLSPSTTGHYYFLTNTFSIHYSPVTLPSDAIYSELLMKLLGRPRCMWVDNIKMELREIGWGGMDWVDLAEDRTSGGLL
jgi:hypothetical protein